MPDKLDAESLTQVDFTASFNTRSAARRRAWHEQHPRLSRTGWSVPLNPAFAGGLAYAAGPEKVRQSIHLILDTEPGERIMRPDFGCGLRRYLMKPNTTATRALIQREVALALKLWEPRIDVHTCRSRRAMNRRWC